MNLSEFKAWFEGFTEDMDKPPTTKQWKRVKARVEEITSVPTPWPVFVERYFQPYQPYFTTPTWPTVTICGTQTQTTAGGIDEVTSNVVNMVGATALPAFEDLGRAEALSIA